MQDQALIARHQVAIAAARQAGDHLRALHADLGALVVEEKGANDYVSRADRESEELIRHRLLEHFPEDGFVGEETGAAGIAPGRAVWVVDPLDGTTNFLRGRPEWCVSIGLVAAGRILAGVIFDPMRDELFDGYRGGGTRVNGANVRVGALDDPGRALVGLGFTPRIGSPRFSRDTEALLATGANARLLGAGALMLAHVASGRLDGYFERHMWPWDAVAGLALIEAAGGVVSPYPVGDDMLAGGRVLAANADLHAAFVTALSCQPVADLA